MEQQSQEKADKQRILAELDKAYKRNDMETYERLEKEALEKYQGQEGVQEYAANLRKTYKANDPSPKQYMGECKLDGLSYDDLCNMCFHFTDKSNLTENFLEKRKGIAVEGLVASRGDWEVPYDDKNNPRVFYVQGIEAAFVRFGLTSTQTHLKGLMVNGESSGDLTEDIRTYDERSNEEKEKKYAIKYEGIKSGVMLNIDESVLDTNLDDEVKKVLGDDYLVELHKTVYESAASEMRGKKPEFNPSNKEQFLKQHKWDKSTAIGQSIAPENLSVASVNGKTSTLELFKFICRMVEKENPKLYEQLADARGFLQYVEMREQKELSNVLNQHSDNADFLSENIRNMSAEQLAKYKGITKESQMAIVPEYEQRKLNEQEKQSDSVKESGH